MNSTKFKHLIYLLLIGFSLLIFDNQKLMAQNVKKFNKYIEKAEKNFENGDFENALKFAKKLEQKSAKKFGAENQFVAVAKLKEAKYNWALGQFKDYYILNENAIAISAKVNGNNSISHGINLIDAYQNMVNYGNYVKANNYLEQAMEIFEDSKVATEVFLANLQLNKADILLAVGDYNEALKIINSKESFFLQRTLNTDGKLKKKELERRYQEAARLITLKSNVLKHKGEIKRADSAFSTGEIWIQDKLNRKNKFFAEHMFLFAEYFEEIGTKELPFSYYSDAYNYSLSSNGENHPNTLKYLEKLILSTIKDNNIVRAQAYYLELEKTLKANFKKSSSHFVKLATISFESNLKKGELTKVENAAAILESDKNLLPSDHPIRIELLNTLVKVAAAKNIFINSENYLNAIIDIKSQLYGDTSVTAAFSKIDLAHHYIDYTDKFDKAVEIYNKEYFGKVEYQITNQHNRYVNLLNHLATSYQIDDDYKKASSLLDEALLVTRIKYDNKDIDFGKELNLIANLQIKIGEYEKAGENIKESLAILENFDNENNVVYYIMALETYAKLLSIRGFFDEAEEALELSQKLYQSSVPSPEYNPLVATQELASVYLKVGKYSETEEILIKSLKRIVKLYGNDSRKIILPLVDFGKLYLIKGDYVQSEEYARRALEISESVFGENSTKNAPAILLLGELYETIGDYNKSEEFYRRAITVLEKQFGRNHVDVATTISRLAIVMFYKGTANPSEIENLLFEAKATIGKRFSTKSPLYADLLKDMALFFISQDKLDEALSFLEQSENIWKEKVGKRNNIKAADIHILRGDVFYKQKKWRDAESEYSESQALNEKFFNNQHPEYVKATSRLSKVFYMDGNKRKAKTYIEEVMKNYTKFIEEYFPALSESEKTKYWNTIRNDYDFFNTMAITMNDRFPELIETVYNNSLKIKGLLLSSSIKMRERILNSNDSTLKTQYFEWLDKKESLSNAISMSQEQLVVENIDLNTLAQDVELIEKNLSQQSELFNQGITKQDLSWEKVRETLQPNEVAIEMVRFRYFDHYITDSIVYLMLILKNEKRSRPEFVIMGNGNDMESKYFNNYRNAIKYRITDSYSYNNFWKPIEDNIGKNKTIYLSPDGVYNQINLETIPTDDGKYLIDNSNIVWVSNTKDLFLNKVNPKQQQEEKTALLFGDPKFYLASRSDYISKFRSGATQISDLPGTKKEINALTQLFDNYGWKTKDYLDEQATESKVKELESPKVFHIATHGFFTEKEDRNPKNSIGKNDLSDNPLLNTGLMLTGSGDLLAKTRYNYNIEPGILTAYEAMNLNLDKTDLVVLSACETGLGEVHGGEGVFGLQRSFLVAGAKTLIMSLFKVSDEATQKLMVSFYEKWLETGDKRQAFIDAKKEIRNQYKDPIYWGAFVMIGI
ncbi:CHAT domain-containing tetratricopeptide repeat protein [Marivirga sp.]|uniref:CHAT domain-containing tetratricopeptide repeat protein n=1 Tax=Marivirga sp. TaxID=2018662 RepID=UPI002D7EED1C|nr:CHAT domain-containing tetratricopeptide repeat protein [Marivirga sp.]HET8860094.1 CHAT domain-containing tetratricopeptide repeat protein [Marivirga sp.]